MGSDILPVCVSRHAGRCDGTSDGGGCVGKAG